jgi:hypothetical protein
MKKHSNFWNMSKYAALSRLVTLLGFPIFGWVCTIGGGHLACALHTRNFLMRRFQAWGKATAMRQMRKSEFQPPHPARRSHFFVTPPATCAKMVRSNANAKNEIK